MLCPLTFTGVPAYTEACKYERVFGSRALTALRAYGLGSDYAKFYLCLRGKTPCAALYLAGGMLSISSEEHADPTVIADFVRENPVREIVTTLEQCEALQKQLGGTILSSYYMVYRGGPVEDVSEEVQPGDLEAALELLRLSHEYYRDHLVAERRTSVFKMKAAKGCMEVYNIVRDGKVVATGSIVGEDDECASLSAIAVLPEYRGQGLGSAICRKLTDVVLKKGKTPRLISGYDEVSELFRENGFAACGRWGALFLDDQA